MSLTLRLLGIKIMRKETNSKPLIILSLVLSALSLLLLALLCCLVMRSSCCRCLRRGRPDVVIEQANDQEQARTKELEKQIAELFDMFPEQAFVPSHVEFG